MSFELSALPYAQDALEPYISSQTLDYHHGKHHRAYVTKLNSLVEGTKFENSSLIDILKTSTGNIFNNAAQVWNHNFYWKCLAKDAGGEPTGKLALAINAEFGSFELFKTNFSENAVGNFGSGWTWLIKKSDGAIAIVNTSNAQNPLTSGELPLLTCDVWEHAYYIDYHNARPNYLDAFWALVNWEFVSTNFLQCIPV